MKISTLKLLKARVAQSTEDFINDLKGINKKKAFAIGSPIIGTYALLNIINPTAIYADVNDTKPSLSEIIDKTKLNGKIGIGWEMNGEKVNTSGYSSSNNGNVFSINPELRIVFTPLDKLSVFGDFKSHLKFGKYQNSENSGYSGFGCNVKLGLDIPLTKEIGVEFGGEKRFDKNSIDYSGLHADITKDLDGFSAGVKFRKGPWEGILSYHSLWGDQDTNVVGFRNEKMRVDTQEIEARVKASFEKWSPYLSVKHERNSLREYPHRDTESFEIGTGFEASITKNCDFIANASYGIGKSKGTNGGYWKAGAGIRYKFWGNDKK